MSWPYPKCVGVRADGERCQGRANAEGLYCHHHDPERSSSASQATAADAGNPSYVPAGPAVATRENVPDETADGAFAATLAAMMRARREASGTDASDTTTSSAD
jgi:Family of unknown function (DUF5763)